MSERKSFTIPLFQSDNFSFNQNDIARSQGNFPDVIEKSGKGQGELKVKKSGHPAVVSPQKHQSYDSLLLRMRLADPYRYCAKIIEGVDSRRRGVELFRYLAI